MTYGHIIRTKVGISEMPQNWQNSQVHSQVLILLTSTRIYISRHLAWENEAMAFRST